MTLTIESFLGANVFIETEIGWHPCQVSDIKQGQTFYIERDGVQGEICFALSDARISGIKNGKTCWFIDSAPLE